MKILCMLPVAKGMYPPDAEEQRVRSIVSYATSSTRIDVVHMPGDSGFNPWGGGAGAVMSPEVDARAAALTVQCALQAEQDGYDAFCPFGTRDLGLKEARAAVTIPVVGQTQACLLFCGMLKRRFASVVYMPGSDAHLFKAAQELGVDHLMVARTAIGIPNSEYPHRRDELLERFMACAQEARAAGAELMGLVAMSICPTEYSAKTLTEACGLPVLDAMACQIALAETWHRVGLSARLLSNAEKPRGEE